MVGANGDATFERHTIAVAPSEISTGPIEVRAVPVGKKYLSDQGKVEGEHRFQTVYGWLAWSWYVAVPDGEDQGPGFCVVEVEGGHSFQLEERLQVEFDAGPYLRLRRITPFSGFFRLKDEANI